MYPLVAFGLLIGGGMLVLRRQRAALRALGVGLLLLGCGMLLAVISGRIVLPLW